MFDFNKSLMFLHKKADLPTYEGVCWALNRHFRVFGLRSAPAGIGSHSKNSQFSIKERDARKRVCDPLCSIL